MFTCIIGQLASIQYLLCVMADTMSLVVVLWLQVLVSDIYHVPG